MASHPIPAIESAGEVDRGFVGKLADPARAIASPRLDALLLWGVPALVLAFMLLVLGLAEKIAPGGGSDASVGLFLLGVMLTYGHLVAVVPRAYLNKDVFAANRRRLTIVPVILVLALAISPTIFVLAGVVAFFWDVHHSAMQTFGIGRIYEFKAGNGPHWIRKTDLYLNWLLYVGPIFVGASFMVHAGERENLAATPLTVLSTAPGLMEQEQPLIRNLALAAWAIGIVWAVMNYRRAMAQGYRPPAHKLALIGVTGVVTFLCWGYLPPLVAFISINIHHALQYYLIVWVQEGKRITAFSRMGAKGALMAYVAATMVVAIGYNLATQMDSRLLLVPFLACSLLHFWYDGFVWSVRKKSV